RRPRAETVSAAGAWRAFAQRVDATMLSSALFFRWCAIALVLLTLGGVLTPPCACAAADARVETGCPGAAPPLGSLADAMGNPRARMIQVGCVAVAVGIFLLSRSYR